MNIRLLTLSTAASALLTAATPMVPASMSTDNGGIKSAIDAYSDGGGVVIINQAGDTKFDNSAMNGLVFKYGQKAEDSGTTLKNQVTVLSADTTAAEKAISVKFDLAKVVINPPVNGISCDDGNPQTVSDVWTSGLCGGKTVISPICSDMTMTWDGATNLCKKNTSSNYAATETITGYTLSGDTLAGGLYGLQKVTNGFRIYYGGTLGSTVYLDPTGVLTGETCGGDICLRKSTGIWFYAQWGSTVMATTSRVGTGISGHSYVPYATTQKIGLVLSGSGFYWSYAGWGNGATVSWVPFYAGTYACPSGGTLSGSTCTITTLTTAPGICQSGYTMTENQCRQD